VDPSYTLSATGKTWPGGCFTCVHFVHRIGSHVFGEHGKVVLGNPDRGCVFWMREVGADLPENGAYQSSKKL